jgi:serine protease Do
LDTEVENVKIADITPGSGAAKAGLRIDDIILAINGTEVRDSESLLAILGKTKPGDKVKLKVRRGDEELEPEATLGKRPAMTRDDFQNSLGSELSTRRSGFPRVVQHDSVLRPIDCGGPLVDLDGRVIGINLARAGRTESFAVPAETVQPLLKELMSGRLAPETAQADKP